MPRAMINGLKEILAVLVEAASDHKEVRAGFEYLSMNTTLNRVLLNDF